MRNLTYIGEGIYRERTYLTRQPKVGDRIEYVGGSFVDDYPIGSEGTVVSIEVDVPKCIYVKMDRRERAYVSVHEDWIAIYEDRHYRLEKEEVDKKRFLGIPFGTKTIQHYEEVTK